MDLLVRNLRRRHTLLPDLGLHVGQETDAAALELVGTIIKRCVYHDLLPHFAGVESGQLAPLLRRQVAAADQRRFCLSNVHLLMFGCSQAQRSRYNLCCASTTPMETSAPEWAARHICVLFSIVSGLS